MQQVNLTEKELKALRYCIIEKQTDIIAQKTILKARGYSQKDIKALEDEYNTLTNVMDKVREWEA